jgi:hypothetical protein
LLDLELDVKIAVVSFGLLLSLFALAAGQVVKSGTFRLKHKIDEQVFSERLLDLDRFAEVFVQENTFEDFVHCDGWTDYARVRGKVVNICSSATLLGYRVVAKNDIRIVKTQAPGCADSVLITLTVDPRTRPGLVQKNVKNVITSLCLKMNLREVSYQTSIVKGDNTSIFFFNYIKGIFVDSTPYLIKTVQVLLD